MGKILFLIIIAILIFWLIKIQKTKQSNPKDSIESVEDMVICSHCGTHIPKNEALSNENNQYFCSAKHRELHIKS